MSQWPVPDVPERAGTQRYQPTTDTITTEDGHNVYWDREEYNRRNERPVNRHPLRNRWTQQGYTRSDPYSNTIRQRPVRIQETSFSETPRRIPGVEGSSTTRISQNIREEGSISEQSRAFESSSELRSTSIDRNPYTRIQIESGNSEFTPLLSGTSAGATATSGGTTAAGIATGGILGAVGLGYGVHKATESIKEHGAVLPGTEYVGPGNPIREGPARHATDQAAREHDLGYTNVLKKAQKNHWTDDKFRREINKLDEITKNQFWSVYKNEGAWQALVGALGLRIKQAVESKTGVLYPSFSGTYKCLIINHHRIRDLIGAG